MISFDPPPNGFSTGPTYSSPLRIYFQGERYWVYDRKGFLCTTDSLEEIGSLLQLEAQRPTNNGPYGARESLLPEAWEARKEMLARRDAAHTAAFGEPKPFPRRGEKKPYTRLSLGDLGL